MSNRRPEPQPPPPHGGNSPLESSALLARGLRTLAGRVGIVVFSFAFAVALARILEPAGRGNFAILQALNGLTVVLSNFAIQKALIHHLGRGIIPKQTASSAAIELALLSGVIGAALLIPIALGLGEKVFGGIPTPLIITAILLATARLIREYSGGVMISASRPLDFVYASAVQPIAGLGILVAMLLVGHHSLTGVVGAWTAGTVLSALAAIALTLRYSKPWPPAARGSIRLLGTFGLKTYPAFVARFLNLKLDQFLVRVLASAAVLGHYAIAVNVGELLIKIPTIMLLAVSGEISARERKASGELTAQFCRWTIIMLGVAMLLLAAGTPLGVPFVFGSNYRPAVPAVLLLLPGMLCYAPAVIITEYFIVQRGQPLKAALIAGTSMLTSTILNFPLTPRFGAGGASLASTLSYVVMFLVSVRLFTRDTGLPWSAILGVSSPDLRAIVGGVRSALKFRGPGAT